MVAVIPRLSWPLQLDGPSLATVEQDSLDEIAQCVTLILSTKTGTRAEVPGYGIDDPIGQKDLASPDVLASVQEWEPRALIDIDSDVLVEGVESIVLRLQGENPPAQSAPPINLGTAGTAGRVEDTIIDGGGA
jgi:phage baseplate assembly protein W